MPLPRSSTASAIAIESTPLPGLRLLKPGVYFYDKCTTAYASDDERGFHFASFGFAWPTPRPILSDRDRNLPPLSEAELPDISGATAPSEGRWER